jgi:hypothetical protein
MKFCAPLLFLFTLAACGDSAPTRDTNTESDSASNGSADTTADTSSNGSADTTADTAVADTTPATTPGQNQAVRAMQGVQIYFTGSENRRQVEQPVTFPPASETFSSINLHFALSCPAGSCDPWDRVGSYGLVLANGSESPTYVELSRFITPYGVGAEWDVDVTDLRPLLTGEQTSRVFIDTWVGPGSGFGNGWSVTATFEFVGGTPAREVLAAIPVWQGANENRRLVYGDPARSIPSQLPDATVALPEGTTSAALRTFITGHGQGNADNCAEFCPRDHTFLVNAVPYTENIWRDDCRTTAAPNQQGSWQYARAGWCPGAKTYDWTIDLGAISEPTLTVGYDVQAFENSCRPEANPCAGCTLGTGCAYNDSNHTEPNYQVSAVVIAYK